MSRTKIILYGGPHDGTEISINGAPFVLTLETQKVTFDTEHSQGWSKDTSIVKVEKETYFATGREVNDREVYAPIKEN